MSSIIIENLCVDFDQHFALENINLEIAENQHWALVGPNGSGKSALVGSLLGAGQRLAGSIRGLPDNIAVVSFEAQAQLIETERKKDDADLLDVISEGTPVVEILKQHCVNPSLLEELIEAFGFRSLLDQSFRKLSSGETRKVMLMRAFTSAADLLILDEPFEGLDVKSYSYLENLLAQFANRLQLILVLNRFDEIPGFVSHLGYMDSGRLLHQVDRSDPIALKEIEQLLHLKTTDLTVPLGDVKAKTSSLNPEEPLVRIRNGKVAYGDKVIFQALDWTINAGQHWQVTGPNGCGKTCLLNLITGDHPQCYVNDIFVFGMQRGSGESIWEIKQHLGYVSSALQWEYKVSVSVQNAIISGFYDSIGIYQQYSDNEKNIAHQWLKLLGMRSRAEQPFNQLSFGDQRLVLIARAMVKHPPLLILDEPCLGLDDLNRQLVLALIEKICAASETTVLYVNHRSEDNIHGIEQHLDMSRMSR
jgi:molybdate transport system ATP-binding protein